MIVTLQGSERESHASLFEDLFRMRALVFSERLRWDVSVVDGLERDVYDDMNPAYIMSLDDQSGRLRGAVRILPTTGRHMMRDIFDAMFDHPLNVESPLIWECTRFCVHPDFERQRTPTGLNLATCELLKGVCDTALAAGISQLLGVSEISMYRIYRRSGWVPEIIGRAEPARTAPIFAGLWDVSTEVSATIASRSGVGSPKALAQMAA